MHSPGSSQYASDPGFGATIVTGALRAWHDAARALVDPRGGTAYQHAMNDDARMGGGSLRAFTGLADSGAGSAIARSMIGAALLVGMFAGVVVVGACGKPSGAADAGLGSAPATTDAVSSGAGEGVSANGEVAAEDVTGVTGAADAAVDPEAAARAKVLAGLAALEIDGLTRGRGEAGAQVALLQFDEKAPNAKGQSGTVELSAGFCAGCAPLERATFEARRDELRKQLGDMHAKNPALVLDIADFELMPERKGVAIYTRSFVVDGEARALVHTLEVQFVDNGRVVHLTAYPRSGIPASAADLAQNYTRAELEALVRKVFGAVAKVLWPAAPSP